MSIAQRIAESTTGVVKIGRYHYRFHAVDSAAILTVGGSTLMALPKLAAPAAGETDPVDPEAAAQARKARIAQRIKPEQVASGRSFEQAVVAAGIEAISEDGELWEAFAVVLDRKLEDGSRGRVHVSAVNRIVPVLAKAILEHTSDAEGGVSAADIARFLGGLQAPGGGAR